MSEAGRRSGARAARSRSSAGRDPTRRDRIADAAIRVIADHGVEGLTHRSVAAVAGVPLGSTTYHFHGLDDLLTGAMERAAASNAAELRAWADTLRPDCDLEREVAELIIRLSGAERERTVVEYELYLAALRRPALREISGAWSRLLIELLTPRLDRITATTVAAAVDGLLIRALIEGAPLDRADLQRALGRIIDSAPRGKRVRRPSGGS
jgi:DNA-binding transcriptional regulator YbjK